MIGDSEFDKVNTKMAKQIGKLLAEQEDEIVNAELTKAVIEGKITVLELLVASKQNRLWHAHDPRSGLCNLYIDSDIICSFKPLIEGVN
jgi:hypothetical protein